MCHLEVLVVMIQYVNTQMLVCIHGSNPGGLEYHNARRHTTFLLPRQ